MKKFLILTVAISMFVVFMHLLTTNIHAQTPNFQDYIQNNLCQGKNGSLVPYKALVLVNLNNYLNDSSYTSNDTLLSELLYEMLYVKDNQIVPFNAIVVNNHIYYTSCQKYDFTLNPYLSISPYKTKYGIYVLGFVGDFNSNKPSVQQIINKYHFDTVFTAKLEKQSFNLDNTKNTHSIYVANNFLKCKNNCGLAGLSKNALYSRPINISIKNIEYTKKIKSMETTEVTVYLVNNSKVMIPDLSYGMLYLKEITPVKVPELYNKTWDSLHRPVVINKQKIMPGQEVTVKFVVGPYIYPQSYSGKFAVYWQNKRLANTNFGVSVKVDKGNYKLGYIVGKKLNYVNVRSKPDLRAPVAFQLDVGVYVIVNKVDGAWVNITSQDGATGWVYRPLIKLNQ